MPFADPLRYAAWQHHEVRNGFAVVFLRFDDHGCRLEGDTAAVEQDVAWAVRYDEFGLVLEYPGIAVRAA